MDQGEKKERMRPGEGEIQGPGDRGTGGLGDRGIGGLGGRGTGGLIEGKSKRREEPRCIRAHEG